MHLTFASGNLQLEGDFDAPPAPTGAAVICHPHPLYGGDMQSAVVLAIRDGLRSVGFATLRFNFRGVGGSEGGYEGGAGETDDVRAAAAEVMRRTGRAICSLAGYSFGAMMVAQVAPAFTPADRLVLVAPPISFGGLAALAACTKPKLFVVGDRDGYCPMVDLERALAALAEPKRHQVVVGADHFFGGYEDEISDAVAAFVGAAA